MDINQDPFEGADLVLKYLRGELSPEQEEAFPKWLKQDAKNAAFFNTVLNEELLNKEIDFYDAIDADKHWQDLVKKANEDHKIKPRWQQWPVLKYAALFLFLLLSALCLYKFADIKNKAAFIAASAPLKYDVKPGSDKAILTLADGTKVCLDEAADGVLRTSKALKIIKQKGQVVYQFTGESELADKVKHNTISTPKGGQYQLVLPDGTQVWLNAASSLRFPTAFAGEERRVELRGEGYFEVSKYKDKPFKIVANTTVVEVLGTHFNVKAYPDEKATNTTLLEGSVKVSNGNAGRIIKPGEQAIVDQSAGINIVEADLEQVTAWKQGYFQFNNEQFHSIAHQLERWYDIEFVYPPSLADKQFAGAIPRNTNLSQVLKILELSGSIKFKIEERRITVISQD
jgi:transmembrane sensor